MNLGAQAAARTADRLIFRPPFLAPAACWDDGGIDDQIFEVRIIRHRLEDLAEAESHDREKRSYNAEARDEQHRRDQAMAVKCNNVCVGYRHNASARSTSQCTGIEAV
jgi:hypothetical protein